MDSKKEYSSYGKQNLNKDDVDAVVEVLRSDRLTQGSVVQEFEKQLASYCGAKYAVANINGTAALHLAYMAADIGKGDEVITTPNTFVATSNMLLAVGATPVFCDIRLDTYNIDEQKIEGLITEKTKAIVPMHFGGTPCEMEKIFAIANKHNLKVIEDASHALGASYKGKKIGNLSSNMTTFSFHPVKPITTAEGGAVVTNSKKHYEKLVLLRGHGIHKDTEGTNIMTELGYNYRMPDLLATLGVSQLRRLNEFIVQRRKIAVLYEKALKSVSGITLPANSSEGGWHIYVIRTKDPKDRRPLREHLAKKGVGVNFHYPAVYKHPYYQEHGYKNVELPNTEKYHNSCITLPLHTKMNKEGISFITGSVKEFFTKT